MSPKLSCRAPLLRIQPQWRVQENMDTLICLRLIFFPPLFHMPGYVDISSIVWLEFCCSFIFVLLDNQVCRSVPEQSDSLNPLFSSLSIERECLQHIVLHIFVMRCTILMILVAIGTACYVDYIISGLITLFVSRWFPKIMACQVIEEAISALPPPLAGRVFALTKGFWTSRKRYSKTSISVMIILCES